MAVRKFPGAALFIERLGALRGSHLAQAAFGFAEQVLDWVQIWGTRLVVERPNFI